MLGCEELAEVSNICVGEGLVSAAFSLMLSVSVITKTAQLALSCDKYASFDLLY